MEEVLVQFETAKLAKEEGFQTLCFYCYDQDGVLIEPYVENGSSTDVEFKVDLTDMLENHNYPLLFNNMSTSAPTQNLLQKWLRDEKELIVCVGACDLLSVDKREGRIRHYYFFIHEVGNRIHSNSLGYEWKDFDSYEKALECGLKEALIML